MLGIKADEVRINQLLNESLMLVTALNTTCELPAQFLRLSCDANTMTLLRVCCSLHAVSSPSEASCFELESCQAVLWLPTIVF